MAAARTFLFARVLALILALVLVLASMPGAAPALAQVRTAELYAPRPFGYVIGDTIAHEVEIALEAPFLLDPATLPQPRPLNYWLELRQARLEDQGARDGVRRYVLHLLYQTFYAPLEPKRLEIPALALSAAAGDRRAAIAVPAWSFLMSPLREIAGTAPGQAMALRPDIEPRPIPTAATRHALAAAAVGAVLALAALAWQRAWWPFARRRNRPFTRAVRTVRSSLHSPARISASPDVLAGHRAALLALHRAFDATAGKGVFAEDLPGFFEAHPAFRAGESEIRRLFAVSRQVFFGAAGDNGDQLAARELIAIAQRLRALERGA